MIVRVGCVHNTRFAVHGGARFGRGVHDGARFVHSGARLGFSVHDGGVRFGLQAGRVCRLGAATLSVVR